MNFIGTFGENDGFRCFLAREHQKTQTSPIHSVDFPIHSGLFDEIQPDLRWQRLVPTRELQHLQLGPLHRGLRQRGAAGGAEGVGRRRARCVARVGLGDPVGAGGGAHHLAWEKMGKQLQGFQIPESQLNNLT